MMDLELNEAQRAARDTARRFARERLTTAVSRSTAIIVFPPRSSPNWGGSA
jgi:hypothetical protein